jgi:DNA-binding Lrp family transcriptional regulator
MKVYLLLNVKFDQTEKVIDKLKTIPNLAVSRVFGAYDLVCTIWGEDPTEMKDTVQWKIRSMPEIQSMMSLIATSPVKEAMAE